MKRAVGIIAVVVAICVFFFRPYFFNNKLLFPTNLLMGYYAPWNTEKPPGWDRGVPFKGLGHDNLTIFYPMKTLLRKAVTEGSFPFWTPYNFAGAPLFGDGQSAVMYPLTLLYIFFPSLPDAFSIMVVLVPFLTMLFTYGMLRHFKLSPLGALFGAVTFAFSGFMSVWMEENPAVSQSAIWLPLLVWLLDLLIVQPKRLWFALFAVFVAIMMTSGFLQIGLYELVFLAAYGLFRARDWRRRGVAALSGFIGLLLVSPYLFTTWEAYKLSPRDFVQMPEIRSLFLVRWPHIVSLFNPDWLGNPGSYNYHGVGSYYDRILFIGVVPLLFSFIGLFSKKTTWEKFFWWAAGISAFLGFSSPFTQWLFAQPIPILSSMLPSRIFYLTSFTLALLSAGAFDRIGKSRWWEGLGKIVRPMGAVYLSLLIIVEVFLIVYLVELSVPDFPIGEAARAFRMMVVSDEKVTGELFMVVLRNIGVSVVLTGLSAGVLFAAYKMKRIRLWVPLVLLFLTVISAWYFSSKSFYFGERQFLYAEHEVIAALQKRAGIDRIGFANDLSRIKSGINTVYGLYSAEGVNPVFPFRYGQLVRSAINGGKLTNDIPRISVEIALRSATEDANEQARLARLVSLLGIKYIVERRESGWYRDIYPNHTVTWEGTYFRIWENPDILPRAFFAANIVVTTDAQTILDTLYDPTIDFAKTAVVETPVVGGDGVVEIMSYRMNSLTMKTQSTQGGFLVVTDNFAPGWRADIDGVEAPVYRTNFTFRGVPVPSGEHTVTMYYLPQPFIVGLWAMGAGIVLLIGSIMML